MSRLLPLAALFVGLTGPVLAADPLTLQPIGVPMPLLSQGKVNTVVEASGVQLVGDRGLALVAHDKLAPLHVMDLASGELVGEPIASPRFLAASKAGPKWEGMARDSDGDIYLIGSHGGATDEERVSHSVLLRFRLTEGPTPGIDDASVVSWDISRTLVAALKAGGVSDAGILKRKIEGLAVLDTATGDGQDVIRLLMVYDNDSLKTKIPSRFQTFRLVREAR